MATVTSYTAERMKAIEDGTVVDGDVVGNDLILTRHDGSQINAGNVRGPQGTPGPPSSDLVVVTAQQVLDVGMAGQVRAGRQLTAADFTNMGLSTPLGLWNLSDLTDASGNGRNLQNKNGVTFDKGINGQAATAAKFRGASGTPANDPCLYIPSPAADVFAIKTGSFGGWTKTAKAVTAQQIISKWTTGQQAWCLYINGNNFLEMDYGAPLGAGVGGPVGITGLSDDRWHFCVGTFDGTTMRIYVDGYLEGSANFAGHFPSNSTAALNIGAALADAGANVASPHFGRIDEVFVTADVLSEEQIRNLYCVKIPHILGAVPSRVSVNVRRRRRGATLAVADFPVQPRRLHNFIAGSLGDEGAHGVALAQVGNPATTTAADGLPGNAYNFLATLNQYLRSTDANLPDALLTRSMGLWFKTIALAQLPLIGYGATGNGELLWNNNGYFTSTSGSDALQGPYIADGLWHHGVVVIDNAADAGIKRKLYLDGVLVASSTVMGNIALGGANFFTIGANAGTGANPTTAQIDSVFVTNNALTQEDIVKLYTKSSQAMAPSPQDAGSHVEALTATDILAIFDTLDLQQQIDLGVAA